MKTVMQEFADKLEQMAIIREQEGSACAGVWNAIHHWATQMIDKEKEQMIDFGFKIAEEANNLIEPTVEPYEKSEIEERFYNQIFKSE